MKSTPSLGSCWDLNTFWYQFFFSPLSQCICQWNLYSLTFSLHGLPFSTEKWLLKPVWFQGGPPAARLLRAFHSILTRKQAASKMATQTYHKWDHSSQHLEALLSLSGLDFQVSLLRYTSVCLSLTLKIKSSERKSGESGRPFLSFPLRRARGFYGVPCANSAIQVFGTS